MRTAILLLLLLSVSSAANSYGYSRITLERSWTVHNGGGSEIGFEGALVVNNSNQRVVALILEPGIKAEVRNGSVIWIRYDGPVNESMLVIKGMAVVDVDYDPHITSDARLPGAALPATNLTGYDEDMARQAGLLASENSSLETIKNLADWTHRYVTYDISYWGKAKSAMEVYSEKRGVCVEYTHLFIAMARSLGFQTRYVSGYVNAGAWQSHAWAEVYAPAYGWLPVDPTFGQVGSLDSTHVAVNYGDDQFTAYDVLLTKDTDVTVDSGQNISTGFASEDPRGVSLSILTDNSTYVADVSIMNSRDEYVFGSYVFLVPESYGGETSAVLLLHPGQTMHRFHGINHSLIEGGYSYTIPIAASFNDAKAQQTLTLQGTFRPQEEQPPAVRLPPCALPAILLLLPLLMFPVSCLQPPVSGLQKHNPGKGKFYKKPKTRNQIKNVPGKRSSWQGST